MPHMVFCGPEGLGKATYAGEVAKQLSVAFDQTSASVLRKKLDLSGVLTNGQKDQVFLVDRVDLLNPEVLELLTGAVRDFQLDLLIGSGPGARMRIPIQEFTLIGTAPTPTDIPSELRDMVTVEKFADYTIDEFKAIVEQQISARQLVLDSSGLSLLTQTAEGNPGQSAMLLERLTGYTRQTRFSLDDISSAFDFMGIHKSRASSSLITRLRSMSGLEFESWTAALFEQQGFRIDTTPTTGDHGIDLIIQNGRDKAAVQCKRWTDTIGEPVIREFYGALLHSGIRRGMVVTTSTFSIQAKLFVRDKPVQLLDLTDLLDLYVKGTEPSLLANSLFMPSSSQPDLF